MDRRRALLAAAALLPLRAAASGSGRFAALDRFLADDTRPGGHLGAVALVAQHGRVLHWRAYGARDVARREPMPRDAIFRIYSMSKPITSVAVLMLMDDGRLALDEAVARHLPCFSDVRPAPTLRQLLTHTAGFATLPGDATHAQLQQAAPWQAADLAGYACRVAAVPLAAAPGSRFAYDGVNTEVLARVVEVAAGMPFDVFLQRRLFEPLRLHDTGFTVPPAQRARVADLSALDVQGAQRRLVLADTPSARAPGTALNAYASGAGGLYSTAPDYARFAQMLLDDGRFEGRQLLAPASVALLHTNQLAALEPIAALAPGQSFGLGVGIGRAGSATAYGWPGAATTSFSVDPPLHTVAVLLMQHLPRDGAAGELPRPDATFHRLVHQALQR